MIQLLFGRMQYLLGWGLSAVGLGGLSWAGLALPVALAVLPAGGVWLYQEGRMADAERAAQLREKMTAANERERCTRNIAEIERRIRLDVENKVAAAEEAAAAVAEVVTPDEIKQACAREVSCRQHAKYRKELGQ